MPQKITVNSPSGKSYQVDSSWTDEQIDQFVKSQEGQITSLKEPSYLDSLVNKFGNAPNRWAAMNESFAPDIDFGKHPHARVGQFFYDNVVKNAASPAGLAGFGVDAVASIAKGTAFPITRGIYNKIKSNFGKTPAAQVVKPPVKPALPPAPNFIAGEAGVARNLPQDYQHLSSLGAPVDPSLAARIDYPLPVGQVQVTDPLPIVNKIPPQVLPDPSMGRQRFNILPDGTPEPIRTVQGQALPPVPQRRNGKFVGKYTPEPVNEVVPAVPNKPRTQRDLLYENYGPATPPDLSREVIDVPFQRANPEAGFLNVQDIYEASKSGVKAVGKGLSTPIQTLGKIGNEIRTLQASVDLSAPFRQGIFLAGRKEFRKSFVPMFKAFASEDGYKVAKESLIKNPHFVDARNNGLALMEVGERRVKKDLSKTEEQFLGEFVGKYYPGVKRSERAYTTFLNKLRLDTYGTLLENAEKAGRKIDDDFKSQIAQYINNATGRGNFNNEANALTLNGLLFSPRLMKSRVNMLTTPFNPQTYIKMDPFVRKEYFKSLGGMIGYGGALLGTAALAGADVEMDPTSSDFAKIKVGDVRIDPFGGVSQYVRFAAQMAMKQKKSSITGRTIKMNTGKFGAPTRLSHTVDFIQSKEAPLASLITDLMRGKDFKGDKTDFIRAVGERAYPIIIGDLIELGKTDPALLPLIVPAIFGVGVQPYSSDIKPKKSPHAYRP